MVKRAITTLDGGDPASASFHRCAAIRESQRRLRPNYFVDGMTENPTTTNLSRISGPFVVGRRTQGSVTRGGIGPRMSEPIVDAENGKHLSSAKRTNNVIAAEYTQAIHFPERALVLH